jgi:hypothetical protein
VAVRALLAGAGVGGRVVFGGWWEDRDRVSAVSWGPVVKDQGGQLANGYRGLRGRERGDGPLWRLTSDGRGTGPALERLAFLRSYLVDDLPPAASRRALNFISVGSRRSFASFLLVSGRGGCPQRPSDPAASPVVVDRLAPAQP